MSDAFQVNGTDEYLPLRDVVFNTLRQAILTGEMKPGERLMEIHLANKLGVSRTPIREAIRKLELLAVELACDRMRQEELTELGKACTEFKEATRTQDWRKIAAADVRLHDIIVRSTRNDRLIQLVNNLAEQMYRYRFEYIKDATQYERLIQEHNDIYESIMRKDKETAARVVTRHVDNQEEAITRQLQLGKDKQ